VTMRRTLAALILMATAPLNGQSTASVAGAGATFPAPIYRKWIETFQAKSSGIPITYEAIGSEDGIRRLKSAETNFAGADIPLSSAQQQSMDVVVFPMVVGAVVPAYNLPGLGKDLRFTPDVLADIFEGKIRTWNDARIEALNGGAKLPRAPIVVVHRADGSGTTFVFSDFLSKTVTVWRNEMGTNSVLRWPTGEEARGNDGVAAAIKQTPNSIGYIEFIYAVQEHLSYGAVRNAEGKFVRASIDSLTAAAKAGQSWNGDSQISIVNAGGADAYPIGCLTWLLVPKRMSDASKRDRLAAFIDRALSSGQRQAAALGYIALPETLAQKERSVLAEWKGATYDDRGNR
jgi:phosphate transport system substrate-binding protein